MGVGPVAELGERFFAQLATGDVDDAGEAQRLLRIRDQPEVREDVFDFPPLIEPQPADQAVGDAAPKQDFFKGTRLRVRSIEDGDIAEPVIAFGDQAQGLSRDGLCLLLLVIGLRHHHLRPARPIGPEPFFGAVRIGLDDVIRGVEDNLRRSIVLLQLDDLRIGIVVLKRQNVAHVRAAEHVDALVVVAHDAEVAMLAGEMAHHQVLRPVGVLVLVDHDVFEPFLVLLEHLRVAIEQPDRPHQQIVEVERVVLLEKRVIAQPDPGCQLLVVRACRP